jgi:hypothetical protein
LRQQGLIQIDFSGFVPGNRYAQTTSLFLTRDLKVQHLKLAPVGGTGYNWETKLEKELQEAMSHPLEHEITRVPTRKPCKGK